MIINDACKYYCTHNLLSLGTPELHFNTSLYGLDNQSACALLDLISVAQVRKVNTLKLPHKVLCQSAS